MGPKPRSAVGVSALLDAAGIMRRTTRYAGTEVVYSQGDTGHSVLYIEEGGVKLSVLSKRGREAVVAILGPGSFFGEACLAGRRIRTGRATTTMPSTIRVIGKTELVRVLHDQSTLSGRFIAHMLSRNIRIEEDLLEQLFSSSEQRLARTLLLFARYSMKDGPLRVVRMVSQATLAGLVGATRSEVSLLMNKFRKLGFIDYRSLRSLKVNNSLLNVVLHD